MVYVLFAVAVIDAGCVLPERGVRYNTGSEIACCCFIETGDGSSDDLLSNFGKGSYSSSAPFSSEKGSNFSLYVVLGACTRAVYTGAGGAERREKGAEGDAAGGRLLHVERRLV
jgi:hypothetical protein